MKKKLLGGFLWRLLFFISNFVFNIAFARRFGAEQSGTIYTIINSLSLYLLVASLNIETGLGYYAALASKHHFKKLINCGLTFVTIATVLLIPFLLVTASKHTFTQAEWPMWFSLAYVFGNVLVSILQVLFFAKGNYILPNLVLTIFTLLTAGFFALPTSYFQVSDQQCLTVFFLYQVIPAIVLLLLFIGSGKKQIEDKSAFPFTLKPIIRYSLIALAGNVLFFLLYRIDYWFVQYFTDEKALGNYVQVAKFGQLLLLLPTIFSTITMPRITDGSISSFVKPAALAFLTISIACIGSLAVVLLWGQQLFTWLLGKDFSEMYLPALLKIPAIMFLSFQFVLGTWFSGKNRVQYNLYCTAIGIVFIIIFDFLLIPRYGITGASLASLFSYIVVFACASYLYQRKTGESFRDIFKEARNFITQGPAYVKNFYSSIMK